MLLTRPNTMLATIAFAAAALLAAGPAFADEKNEIRAVTFDDDAAGTTRVHVRGASTPTFTVYKLERPSRVVLDVPQARLADALRGHEGASVFTPSTWAVSTIAAQQLDDGGQMVRVIVTMARPGRYDVKTEGNEVVVMISARDAAPKVASPEALARAQAESEQAKKAQAAAEKASSTAQQEAERLRKAATDQMARAEAAQRAADDAKRAAQQASAADVAKANAMAQAAQTEATKAKAMANTAQADVERAKAMASAATAEVMKAKQDAATAQAEVLQMKKTAEQAQVEVTKAKRDAQVALAEMDRAKQDATRTKAEADAVKAAAAQDVAREVNAASRAKLEADQARKDAEAARAEAAKTKDAAARTRAETAAARLEANAAKADAEAAKVEAEQARRDVAQKRLEAEQARVEAAKTKTDIARSTADAQRARSEAEAAKADAARARAEAKAAKAEADAARSASAAEKREAEADKQGALTARAEAEKMLRDAKAQLGTLDKKALEIQAREDKARAAHAAAQAREEAANESVAKATREREAAEAAVKAAAQARDASSSQAMKTAEERLAKAKQAADAAEARRVAAETAASAALKDLDTTRVTLAGVERQRTSAERAANDASRKRSEAEAAASDAARRRSEAEQAAATASKQKTLAESAAAMASKQKSEAEQQRIVAEQQRKAAEAAAKDAQIAAAAAEKQRSIAETAAMKAVNAKHDAEEGLEELMSRREAAEKAAAALEARSKAEAKAQTELAAAKARQANEAELAAVRAEAGKLADERKRAEAELADRRKAVALQQAESDRLRATAAQARDAAEREEKRRAQLAAQRAIEEKQLAALEAQKVKVQTASAPVAAPAATPAKVTKTAFVSDIAFKGDPAAGQVEIAMTGDGSVTLGEMTGSYVELIIDGADLAQKLERKLDVTRFGSPIRAVSSFRDRRTPNRVHLVAELSSPVTPTIDRDGNTVRWRLVGDQQVANQTARKPPRVQSVNTPVVGGFGAASTPISQQTVTQLPAQGSRNRKVYRGATVDFDFKDAPMTDLLRTIADTGKVNIVVPQGIDAKVTLRLKRVPWDQALEVILASHGLWYRRDGNLFRIAPRKELDAEDEAEAARRDALVKSETPRSEVVALNYASAAELKNKLEPMMSPRGRIEVDERTNALIVVDIAGNRAEIQRLALLLDTQTPQISIEARIVEARSTFLRQLGIQWGGNANATANGGNSTGLVFPSNVSVAGGASDAATNSRGVNATPSDFAINLPAPVGSGEGGAIGFALGSVGGNFNLNLRLSALEDSGTVRIISAPKVTVLNNKEAKISQGVSIPISVVSAAGTQTQFVQADLALTVTPYVSQRDCAIAMKLNVTKNEPDFVNVGARGDPTILRKEASTQMLVADGETSVLGGIYTRNTGLAYKKVPFFGDLPVIGWFFKNRRENDDRTEILVFITPKITNKALLRCQ